MTDSRIYTAPKPLAPGKVPGQWTASGNVKNPAPGMLPKGSIWRVAEAAHSFPANTYLRADYPTAPVVAAPPPPPPPPPVVTPPPPPPPPAPTDADVVYRDHTFFIRNAALSLSLGEDAVIGSPVPAPDGWPTASDEENSVPYLGLKKQGWLYDVVARGAIIDLMAIGFTSGTMRTELRAMSFGATADFIGEWDGPVWRGTAGPFDVAHVFSLEGNVARWVTQLGNARGGSLSDLRFLRAMDTDQDASMSNLFKIVTKGTVEAHPIKAGGPVVVLRSDDPRATAYGIPNLMLPKTNNANFDTSPKVPSSATGDGVAALLFKLGSLGAGESVGFSTELEIR